MATGWAAFVVWAVLVEALHLAPLIAAFVAPARADVLLASAGEVLERRSREVMIGVGLVFGVWFPLRALASFGFGQGA